MTREVRRDYSALIEQTLQAYGVWKAGKDNWRSSCPVHKGDNPTTLSVFSNGRWRCFKCGAFGDMARLLMHARHLTLAQARDYLGAAPIPFRRMEDFPTLSPKRKIGPTVPYEVLRDAILSPYLSHCPRYLLGRGFSEESLRRYEVGYDVHNAKIVLPVRDAKSRLVGITYRLDFDSDTSQPAKYWHDNFAKSLHLYGFHFWADRHLRRLYLVEGQLDAIRMFQLGYAACAIMGSEISSEQIDVLLRYCKADRVVLAFDRDEAGDKATKSAIHKLNNTRFGRNLLSLVYPTSDPGELTEVVPVSTEPWSNWLIRGKHI